MAELDARQKSAVDAGPVDVLIAAGAGSGKTRVLSARFVSAVLGAAPYERTDSGRLLAVTFTEKAAGELTERIRGALVAAGEPAAARSMGDAWISTIHGMCSRILRRHALDAGVDPNFVVLSDVEAAALEAVALEETLNDRLSDGEFVRLLDAHSLDTLAQSVRRVVGLVHALGLRVSDIGTVAAAEVSSDIARAAAALAKLSAELGALRKTKTVEANRAVILRISEDLRLLAPEQPGQAQSVLETIESGTLRRLSSVDGHDELVEDAREHINSARAAIAQMLVADLERAFLDFARAFEDSYAAHKTRRALLDFEDLQVRTAMLLEGHPEIARRYREHFVMVMLDESQDANALQLRIIEEISRDNLCTVGDENQSIYAFRHADVELFRSRALSAACTRALDVNYRTTPSLLAGINALFSHPALLGERFMQLRPPADAQERPAPQPPFLVRLIDGETVGGEDAHEAEASNIGIRVEELLSHGALPGQIAVIMRALSAGRAASVESALVERGIPVYITSGGAFFDRPEVIEARALLACIANVRDDAALAVVLAGRLTALHPDSLIALRSRADDLAAQWGRDRRDVHLWEAAADAGLQLEEADAAALARTVKVVERARAYRGTRSLAKTVLNPLLELEADLVLFASGRGGPRAWANLLKLARIASEYESATGGDLGGLLDYLDLRELHATSEQEATLDGEADAVRVMSIHAAKGLEFPHVIVAGLTGAPSAGPIALGLCDGRPSLGMKYPGPSRLVATIGSDRVGRIRAEADAAEAVRLLYVACTRAEESLTVIGRTDPGKDASSGLIDLIRVAMGFAEAGSVAPGDVPLGETVLRAELVPAKPREQVDADDTLLYAARTAQISGQMRTAGTSGQRRSEHAPLPVQAETGEEPRTLQTPRSDRVSSRPLTVSYTGLATYQRCAYRYFLTSIVRLPAPPAARGGEALAFGTAVHAVLERLSSARDDPEPWVELASAAAGLEDAGRTRLRNAVRAYLRSDVAGRVFAAQHVTHEAPITVPIGKTVLVGAIDVVARTGDDVLIVDYKTGTGELGRKEAEQRYRLQGACYATAAFNAGAERVSVVFAEIERDREIPFEYRAADAPAIAGDVLEIVSKMTGADFAARDEYESQLCETCPGLGGLCPVKRPSEHGAA